MSKQITAGSGKIAKTKKLVTLVHGNASKPGELYTWTAIKLICPQKNIVRKPFFPFAVRF
jgi:hypothetical protein